MRTRGTFRPVFKAKVVFECISSEKSISRPFREYQPIPIMVSKWSTDFIKNSAAIFERDHKGSAEQNRIADLEGLRGDSH